MIQSTLITSPQKQIDNNNIEIMSLSQLFEDVEKINDCMIEFPVSSTSLSSLSTSLSSSSTSSSSSNLSFPIHSTCITPIKSPTEDLSCNISLTSGSCTNFDRYCSKPNNYFDNLNNNNQIISAETIEKSPSLWSLFLTGVNLDQYPPLIGYHSHSSSVNEISNDVLPLKKRFKRKKAGLLF